MSTARAKRRKEADRRRRIQLEKTLLAEGLPRERVDAIIEHMRNTQVAERARERGDIFTCITPAETEDEFYERHARQFDDKGYEPKPPDSVLMGTARATGIAVKAIKRRKTLTRYEYDLLQAAP